jgi:hypothetical protein
MADEHPTDAILLRDAKLLLVVPDDESETGWGIAVMEDWSYFAAWKCVVDGTYRILSRHASRVEAAEALVSALKAQAVEPEEAING